MAALVTPAELKAYCAAPDAEDASIAAAAYGANAALEVETGRRLGWRRYRQALAIDGAGITNSTKTVVHASGVVVQAGDVVSGGGLPFGTQVASVMNPTTFVLDQGPGADVGSASLIVGDGLMRAWADSGAWLRVDETPISDADGLYINGTLLDGTTLVVVSHARGLVDVNTICPRGNDYAISGAAGLRSGSEYEIARTTLLRMCQIMWQRQFAHAGSASNEIIGTRSVTRDFEWPADVRRGIDALRRLA